MATQPILRMSVEEYLEYERGALDRHEYYKGEVFLMPGGTQSHSLISVNLVTELNLALRDRDGRVYNTDMRLRTAPSGLYSYADVAVVGSEPELFGKDVLLNPILIAEVLSPATASYDRGAKFEEYRTISTFREYLVIAQDRPYVEHYVRSENNPNSWSMQVHTDTNDTIALESLDVSLTLSSLYRKVQFEA